MVRPQNDSWFTLKWLRGLLLQLVFICALIGNYLVLTLGQVLGMEMYTRDILMDHGQMGFKNYRRSQINHMMTYTVIDYKAPGKKSLLFCKNWQRRVWLEIGAWGINDL